MNAKTPNQVEEAINRLFNERIKDIRISLEPFIGNIDESRSNIISLGDKLSE